MLYPYNCVNKKNWNKKKQNKKLLAISNNFLTLSVKHLRHFGTQDGTYTYITKLETDGIERLK